MRPSVLLLILALVSVPLAGCIEAAGDSTPSIEPVTREFTIEAIDKDLELYPGKTVRMWTFNGQVPGPLIRATEGDRVVVHFTNNGTAPHTLHFHGAHPFSMDGDDHDAIAPGGTFTYDFIAGPAGAYVYHCHVDTPVHIPMGLYGQLVVDPREGWGGPEPDRELFAVFSDWNPQHNATAETYLLNGKAFPSTEPFQVRQGERVRLFVSSMSDFPVASHLHGYLPQQVWPNRQPIDVVPLAHAETRVLEFQANSPGAWMFHDHYEQHLMNDGIYPGGSMGVIEVGEQYWGRFHERMAGMAGGHGVHHGAPAESDPVPEDAVRVDAANMAYSEKELTVPAGTTVVWTNRDSMPHTVTSDERGGPLDSGIMKTGQTYAHTFTEPGTYRYHCAPHSAKGADGSYKGMVATVVVT